MATDKPSVPVPPGRGYDQAYQEAYDLVSRRLKMNTDLAGISRMSGATLTGSHTLALGYLNQAVHIRFPDIEVTSPETGLTVRDRLIILHYLGQANGNPLTGRLLTFQELPEGRVYYPTFRQRGVQPLLAGFGTAPDRLLIAATRLGGQPAALGDAAVTIQALPRVPLTLVLWRGDDEFPPEGNILFDAGITDYLPTEDVTVLCESIAWRLVKLGKAT